MSGADRELVVWLGPVGAELVGTPHRREVLGDLKGPTKAWFPHHHDQAPVIWLTPVILPFQIIS